MWGDCSEYDNRWINHQVKLYHNVSELICADFNFILRCVSLRFGNTQMYKGLEEDTFRLFHDRFHTMLDRMFATQQPRTSTQVLINEPLEVVKANFQNGMLLQYLKLAGCQTWRQQLQHSMGTDKRILGHLDILDQFGPVNMAEMCCSGNIITSTREVSTFQAIVNNMNVYIQREEMYVLSCLPLY